ncbi:hypothetical protein LguiA_035936 [Lonicera macranthoides]
MDRVIKSDIVGCFDNIDHALLNSTIGLSIGQGNPFFCNLIASFLTTEILDASGHNLRSISTGIPQGSPLSPVLMNLFLHQLDLKIQTFLEKEKRVKYVRYADDFLIGIKRGADSEIFSQSFQQMFQECLVELKLEKTSFELIRGISLLFTPL